MTPRGHVSRSLADEQSLPRWGLLEIFVLVLLLSSGLLFLPGSQPLRMVVRALPHMMSLALLLLVGVRSMRGGVSTTGRLLLLAMVLLAINLLHPGTNPVAGLAQWVFQLSIAAPVFWAGKMVRGRAHLTRVLLLVFFASAAHAVVGTLQAYDPGRFLPPYLELTQSQISMFTFTGPFGNEIIRPTGLTDLPGGAAFGAVITVLLGVGLSIRPGMSFVRRLLFLGVAGVGMFSTYVTQIRSFVFVMVVVLMILALFAQRYRGGRVIGWGIGGAVVAGLVWVTSASVGMGNRQGPLARLQDALDEGVVVGFMESRGGFFVQTFVDYLPRYPLGAGVGRWGMMRDYFTGRFDVTSPPLWAEVQITGWLLDGGVPMWLFYGGALLVSLLAAWRLAWTRTDPELAYLAGLVFCLQLFIVGTTFGGPTFNSYQGILYWLLSAGLLSVASAARETRTRRSSPEVGYRFVQAPAISGAR